jgi:hypothetical protein
LKRLSVPLVCISCPSVPIICRFGFFMMSCVFHSYFLRISPSF